MWTRYQIQEVIDWMNTWEQLNRTAIPIRFKEDFEQKYKSDIEFNEMVISAFIKANKITKGEINLNP